jgi:hypothetical protein
MCVIIIHESSITRNRHVAQQYSQECFSMGTLNHRVLHSCNSQNMDKRTSSFMIIPPKPNFIRTMQNTSYCNLQPTFLQNSRGDLGEISLGKFQLVLSSLLNKFHIDTSISSINCSVMAFSCLSKGSHLLMFRSFDPQF